MKSKKPWSAIFDEITEDGPDYRWAGATSVCLCGNDSLAAIVKFDEGHIAMWFTDVRCLRCHAYLVAPAGEAPDPVA